MLSRTVAAFTILLFLVVYFPRAMSAEKIAVNQIDTKQSLVIIDGVEVRVPTPYKVVERIFVERFERSLRIRLSDGLEGVGVEWFRIERLVNVTLDMDLTEIYRKQFRVIFFEPVEYELWKSSKPAKPLAEKDCDWRCKVVLNLGDRKLEDEIYLVVTLNKDEPAGPLNVVTRYVSRFYIFFIIPTDTRNIVGFPIEGLNKYELPLPVRADGFGEVKVRFQSNVPVKLVVECYSERTGEQRGVECRTAEGREGALFFKADLYSRFYLPRVAFFIYNREPQDARVKLWAEFSWAGVPNPTTASMYVGDEPSKTHERVLKLLPRYVEKNWSREDVLWLNDWSTNKQYRTSIGRGFYECSDKTGLDELVIETEEPSGAKYKLLILDRYDSKIFWTHAIKLGSYRDPSDILPLLKPLAEAGPTSKAKIKLSNLKECPDIIAIRADNGTIGIRYKLFTKWTEVPTGIFGDPSGWIAQTSLRFGGMPAGLLTLRVEGEFKAERPVNFHIVDYTVLRENRGVIFYEARNTKSGKFSFYIYGVSGILVVGENLGWEPTEVNVWIKYEPVQTVLYTRPTTEPRVTTSPTRAMTTKIIPTTATVTTTRTQAGTFTTTTAVSNNDTFIQTALLLAGIVVGILVGFIMAGRRRVTSKGGGISQTTNRGFKIHPSS